MTKLSLNQDNLKRGTSEILVLNLLKGNDLYGYQITQLFSEKSGGRFIMLEGTLYPILYRLEEGGYISSYAKLVGKRRTRKYYHLESKGEEYLDVILREYDEIALGIDMILGRKPTDSVDG